MNSPCPDKLCWDIQPGVKVCEEDWEWEGNPASGRCPGFAIPSSLVPSRECQEHSQSTSAVKCSGSGLYSRFSSSANCADFLSLCLQNLPSWKGVKGEAELFIKVGWWDRRRCKSALGSARNCWPGPRGWLWEPPAPAQPTRSPGFREGVAKWAETQGLPWPPAAGAAAGPSVEPIPCGSIAACSCPRMVAGREGAFRCPHIQQIGPKAQTGSQGIQNHSVGWAWKGP